MVLKHRYPDRCICKLTGTSRGWTVTEPHPRCPAGHEREKEMGYDTLENEFFTSFIESTYGKTVKELAAEEGKYFVSQLASAWQAGLEAAELGNDL